MGLKWSDFIPEGQASSGSPATQNQHPKTLLDFANQHHYKITSGYSHGTGHSKGSMHYQGNAKDPGAIDIDHKGVDYNELVAFGKREGYNVLDEVRHPSANSTGPHYHISKARSGSKPTQAAAGKPKPKEISSQPNNLIAPFDVNSLQMPTTTDANGNFVVNQGKPQRNIGAEIGKVVKPEPKRQVSESISLSDFDLDQNDQAEIQAIADRLKTKPKPQTVPVAPQAKAPGLLEGLVDMGKGAMEGLRKEVLPTTEEIRASAPHSIQEAIYNAGVRDNPYAQIGAGALSEAANFANGATDLVGLGKPIPTGGLQNFTENHPVYSTIGRAAPYALGEAGLAKAGMKVAPGLTKALTGNPLSRIATGAGVNAAEGYLVDPGEAGQQGRVQNAALSGLIGGGAHGVGEILGGSHTQKPQSKELGIPKNGFVGRDGEIISPSRHDAPAVNVTPNPENLHTPVQTKELSAAFAERQRPAEAPQIIDPRNQPLPKELGNIKTETTDGGIVLATKAGEREIPQVETASAPAGERVYPTKELQTESIIDPQTGQPYKPQERPLRSAHDAAMLRAEEIAKRTEDVNAPEPQRLPDNPGTDIPNPASREVGQPLLDASGKPMAREIGTPNIERPGQPKPTDPAALELPKNYEKPQPREVGQVEPKAATPEAQPGAYTDTLNELLKDSGLDFAGVQKLKADIDTRKSLLDTTLKNSRSDEAKRLRAELKDMTNRFKTLDPNIQEIAGQQFDPQTGMGQQRPLDKNSQFTLDQVRGNITPQTLPIAEQINKAMQNGTKVRLKYVAEQSGRSNEVAKLSKGGRAIVQTTEFSPTHFGYTNATFASGKKQMPVVHGYNQRGHEVMYYLDKSPKGSHIQQVVSVTDKPAFQGPVSNIHKGPGQYNVTDILSRGARTERGFVKTSDAIKAIHEQKLAMREISNNAILPVESKQRFEKLYSGRDLSYDDLKSLSKDLSKPEKIAQFCKNLGLS